MALPRSEMSSLTKDLTLNKIHRAQQAVSRILHDCKHTPKICTEVPHEYRDKYALAEGTTHALIAAVLTALAVIGLTADQTNQLLKWAGKKRVFLRFTGEEHCTFGQETRREEVNPKKVVTEGSVLGRLSSKAVTTVTEYSWKYDFSYELVAVRGVGRSSDDFLHIRSRRGHTVLVTASKTPPRAEARAPAVKLDVDITWLIKHLVAEESMLPGELPNYFPQFKVDRTSAACRTPRRNNEIEEALEFCRVLSSWIADVDKYVTDDVVKLCKLTANPEGSDDTPDADDVFLPVLPLFYPKPVEHARTRTKSHAARDRSLTRSRASSTETSEDDGPATAVECVGTFSVTVGEDPVTSMAAEDSSSSLPNMMKAPTVMLSNDHINMFIDEQKRTLLVKCNQLALEYPNDRDVSGPRTVAEAILLALLRHLQDVLKAYMSVVDLIERMLRQQLIAAIGREISPSDFSAFMSYHYRKLYTPAFYPKPFSYSIRRSDRHSPEGHLSIEYEPSSTDSSSIEPVESIERRLSSGHPIQVRLNAMVKVSCEGNRFLHAILQHQFSESGVSNLRLVARARQFSSVLVMVGSMSSGSSFDPKHAMIVQNKDELTIPLELSTIPTRQEFKDAISSLSPEQQSFAKAIRSMQIEGTLFGIMVIQIKPQLEKSLNLHDDSLTKEIQLTQDLMELFTKYQVPTDLLSFDGDASATRSERIDAVKSHVEALQSMVRSTNARHLDLRRGQFQLDHPDAGLIGASTFGLGTVQGHTTTSTAVFGGGQPIPFGGLSDDKVVNVDMRNSPPSNGGTPARGPISQQSVSQTTPGFTFGSGHSPPMSPPVPPAHPEHRHSYPSIPKSQSFSFSSSSLDEATPARLDVPLLGDTKASSNDVRPQQVPSSSPHSAHATFDQKAAKEDRSFDADVTLVPHKLESQYNAVDPYGTLRPTVVNIGGSWRLSSQPDLQSPAASQNLEEAEINKKHNEAFDLLDALSKSGGLSIDHADLHVAIVATQSFDKTLLQTVVEGNTNPIVQTERSHVVMATTVHQRAAEQLISSSELQQVGLRSPMLLQEGFSGEAV